MLWFLMCQLVVLESLSPLDDGSVLVILGTSAASSNFCSFEAFDYISKLLIMVLHCRFPVARSHLMVL